jgi:hypothetical protein
MGRENMEDYNADFLVILESWEAAIKYCGRGREHPQTIGAGVGAVPSAAGPIEATGCVNADDEVMAGTCALPAGALWRPAV